MSEIAYHLVHANVARMRAPLDNPKMAGFMARIEEIDALAQNSPGFVAQPTPADEGAVYKDDVLLNMSIWESVESLYVFTYSGRHAQALARRAEWFEQEDGPAYVLYWAPVGHIPTEKEIKERFDHLRRHGATPRAFTFEQRFSVKAALAYSGEET
jgi:hypothetical protein